MTVLFSKNGNTAKMLNKASFKEETYLQEYIHKNPEAIPIYQIDETKKLFVVKREFPTHSGPIDALGVDKDGDIYVIETKLYKNPDKRNVVAQVLDYGAALWRHLTNFDEFITIINAEIHDKFNKSFNEKLSEFFDLEYDQTEIVLQNMQQNLAAGAIKFVILMDSIDNRLKDLIIYINQNSQFDIFATQLDYYRHKEYEIIIPRIFGSEIKKNVKYKSGSTRFNWTEEGFFKEIANLPDSFKSKINNIYKFSKEQGGLQGWGTGKTPNFTFKLKHPFVPDKTSTIFIVWSDGFVKIQFYYDKMEKHEPIIGENEFYNILNSDDNLSISRTQKRTDRFSLENLSENAIERLKKATLLLKNKIERMTAQ